MPLSLYLLAMAVFAMGTSEFMLAGLLPDIASDFDVTVGTAGMLTSAFAIGMIVGAPLVAALARSWPRRSSLFGFVLVFAAGHAVGAVTTSFPVLFATRVVAVQSRLPSSLSPGPFTGVPASGSPAASNGCGRACR